MINPKYAVKCLKLGFLRYQRYRKLPITVEVSNNTISFYAKNRTMERGKNARVSNHHLSMQRFAEKNQPWLCDNISIVFIVPDSPEDKSPRARVYQDAEGSIKEFDVTIYPYNPNVLEPNDISIIFQAIANYLESGEYIDPFKGTDKESEPIPRHSNIKPYKGKGKKVSEGVVRLNDVLLNEIGQYCVNQYLLLNEYNQINCNKNMNRNRKNVVRLTESRLRNIIRESVRQVLREADEIENEVNYPFYKVSQMKKNGVGVTVANDIESKDKALEIARRVADDTNIKYVEVTEYYPQGSKTILTLKGKRGRPSVWKPDEHDFQLWRDQD